MDDVELYIAVQRMKTWSPEWKDFVLSLPADEAKMIVEAVALLDARPTGDDGTGEAV